MGPAPEEPKEAKAGPVYQRPARRLHERWLSRLTGVMPARMARMRPGKSSRSRRCLRCMGRMQYGHRSMPSSIFAKAMRRACSWSAPSPTGGVWRVAVMLMSLSGLGRHRVSQGNRSRAQKAHSSGPWRSPTAGRRPPSSAVELTASWIAPAGNLDPPRRTRTARSAAVGQGRPVPRPTGSATERLIQVPS